MGNSLRKSGPGNGIRPSVSGNGWQFKKAYVKPKIPAQPPAPKAINPSPFGVQTTRAIQCVSGCMGLAAAVRASAWRPERKRRQLSRLTACVSLVLRDDGIYIRVAKRP